MGWFWLGLLAAAILFLGANSVPRGDSAVEVGLLLAAMAALLWGVTEGLSAAGDKEPTVPTNPNNPNDPGVNPIPGTGIQFGRFNRQVSGDDIPWCVATRYRITYVVNGVESDPSPYAEAGPSLTETDPIFTLNRPFGVDEVKWYRSEATDGFQVWRDHTSQMEEVLGPVTGLNYIDRSNPCDTPYRPDPPARPEPFGTFENMWNGTAGQGVVPWCVPTRYRARYVKGNQVSAWSEESIEFYSQIYTQPGVRVEPRDGFDIEWIVSSNITLPAGSITSGPPPSNDLNAEQFWFVTPQDEGWTIGLTMYEFWVPGSSELTIPLSVFVSSWNTNPIDFNPLGIRLAISTDGRLVMDPLVSSLSDTAELVDIQNPNHWWYAMGFNKFEPMNQPIVASRLPRSNIVHTGPQFIDTNNMCRDPNAPLDRPEFVRWSGSVSSLSPYPWCKPTKYRYAYVVNGVQSDWSPESEFKYDPVLRGPVFQITKPQGIDGVVWERAVRGSNFDEWSDHTEDMIKKDPEFQGSAHFVDRNNPCDTPYVPPKPTRPQPNGVFGNNMWNQEAGEGVVPWCEPTKYYAKYVSDTLESDWSDASVEFQSLQYTTPSLYVEPRAGFQVQWGRKTRIPMLTLPCGFHTGPCVPSAVFRLQSVMGTLVIGPDFSNLYTPTTTPIFRIRIDDFVNAWNLDQLRTSLRRFGTLHVAPSGKLVISTYSGIAHGSYELINGENGGFAWWHEMGFDRVFEITSVIEASRLPGNADEIEIIGSGDILNDVDNPCRKPNPPLNSPDWVKFDRNFEAR